MKKIIKILGWTLAGLAGLLFLTVIYLYIDFPKPYSLDKKHDKPIAIQNVTVIDVENGVTIPNQTVLLKDSLISQISDVGKTQLPEDIHIIDGTGKYLCPGFWDMHIHAWFTFTPAINYPMYLANGVTGLRHMGGVFGLPFAASLKDHRNWDKEVASGKMVGPRMISTCAMAVNGIDSRVEGYPDFMGPETAEQGRKLARWTKENGYDFIKPYDLVNKEAYLAMMDEASKLGIKVGGHKPWAVTVTEAVQAGQKSFEHAHLFLQESHPKYANKEFMTTNYGKIENRQMMMDNFQDSLFVKTCSTMIAHDVYLCPTHITREFNNGIYHKDFMDNPNLKYMPKIIQLTWQADARSSKKAFGKDGERITREYFEEGRVLTSKAYDLGVKILVGTDGMDSYCFPGFALHREMRHLKTGGMSEADILKAVTLTAAEYENMQDQFGSVSVGKYADLILLDKNPLEDIKNTQSIHSMFLNGFYYNSNELEEMLEETEKAAASSLFELLYLIYKGTIDANGDSDFFPRVHHKCFAEQSLVGSPYKTAILKMKTSEKK